MQPEASATAAVNAALKRGADIIVAAVALVVLLPVMLLVAVAVKAETPGPVLFSQQRLGRYGRPFRLYKFRKFADGPQAQGPAVTVHGDARLTRVGRVLQESKLDELPQFWNVLIGDMSLVGPRPESPRFTDCFRDRHWAVLQHRPGLFGPAQVLFRNESALFPTGGDPEDFYRQTLFPAKARLDLAYYAGANIFTDAAWLVRGVVTVFVPVFSGFRSENVLEAAEDWISRHGARTKMGRVPS